MKCEKCMTEIPDDGKFCPACGEQVDVNKKDSKKKQMRYAISFCVAAAVIAASAAVYMKGPASGSDARKENIFYLKDRGLWQADIGAAKMEPVEHTDLFSDNDYEDLSYKGFMYPHGISGNKLISKDGSLVVYPSEADVYGMGFSLYCELDGAEPVMVDKKVDLYEITDNNLIVYLKRNSGLYVSDGKDKKKISSKAYDFDVNDQGTQVIWHINNDDENYTTDIYSQNDLFNGEKVRLAEDAEIIRISDNLDKILIRKENSVYLIENLGEPVKLVEDAYDVKNVNLDQMTFFYCKAPEEKQMLLDYIEDDSESMNGYDLLGYTMDTVKTELEDQEAALFSQLYYYNNGQETLVDASLREYTFLRTEEEPNMISYIREKNPTVKKVKLSDIPYAEYALSTIQDANYLEGEEVVWVNGKTAGLGDYSVKGIIGQRWLTDDSSKFYFTYAEEDPEWQSENVYELYCLSLAEEDFGEITKVDEGVASIECVLGTDAYYLKNSNNFVGDLFLNGDLLLRRVTLYSVYKFEDKSGIVCISDVDTDEGYGTLNLIIDGAAKAVAENVSYCDIIDSDNIVLLRDYNHNKKRGDLEHYDGEKIKFIDEDVFGIIPRGIRLDSYQWGYFDD